MTDPIGGDTSLIERSLAAHGAEVLVPAAKSLHALLPEADAMIVNLATIDTVALKNAPRCRIIARLGVGVDGVDVRQATERGIWVTNVPRYCTDEVAEHTLALILALQRQLRPAQRDLERGLWNQLSYRNIHKASETTLGIVGLGELGRATAAKALAVGFKVIGFDPALASGTTTHGVGIVPLDDLLEASDVVSLHLPLTDHTRHLMNAQRLSEMRRGAFLINVSRGGIVDEQALLNALRDGHLAGAALDAFETEPLPGSSPLHGADNLILTPHIAFLSEESLESLQTQAVDEVIRVMAGAHPLNAVNKVS
ncbi:C-terminal binding protein [Ahrensia marina]|uniref:C-terminal binding protein n=1 Tax=Ahrensia marina TaxID=1514904 RepID=UPI0035CFA286